MCDASLCPLLLTHEGEGPAEFESQKIHPLREHIEQCQGLRIRVRWSKSVVRRIMALFPWRYDDSSWKGYVRDWQESLLGPLAKGKLGTLEDAESAPDAAVSFSSCGRLGSFSALAEEWEDWLIGWFADAESPGDSKGVGTPATCAAVGRATSDHPTGFLFVAEPIKWRLVKYPWLRFYDPRLPTQGRSFEPERRWRTLNKPPRGQANGLLDRYGNEWCWDSYHNDHWDVQLRHGGGHENVSPDGSLL